MVSPFWNLLVGLVFPLPLVQGPVQTDPWPMWAGPAGFQHSLLAGLLERYKLVWLPGAVSWGGQWGPGSWHGTLVVSAPLSPAATLQF